MRGWPFSRLAAIQGTPPPGARITQAGYTPLPRVRHYKDLYKDR
jgi:hypothetical protein